jgi:hypothetical protein
LVLLEAVLGRSPWPFPCPTLGRLNTAQPSYRQNSEEPEITKLIEHTVERAALKIL